MKSILVVGAGPAGAALSYLFAKRGAKVTLLERHRDFAREFRGEVFQPSGVEALEQLGLGEILRNVPAARIREITMWRGGRRLMRTVLAEGDLASAPYLISQPALLEAITTASAAFPSFQLVRGAAVRDVLVEDGRVTGVTFDRDGVTTTLRADLVIGADGRNSVLRMRSGLHQERTPQHYEVVWFKAPRPADWPEGHAEIHETRGGMALAFGSHDGTVQVGWVMEKGTYKELRGTGAWLDALLPSLRPELAQHLRARRGEVTSPFLLDVLCDHLTQWTRPGLLLIGDAAHPMSPVGGQGLNVAVRDSLAAANALLPVLQRDGSHVELDAAANQVVTTRLPEVIAIQKIQSRQSDLMLGKGLRGRLARVLLPYVAKLPQTGRMFSRRERRFAHVIRPLRLEV